ncbi:DUF997 domain-containing protein [Desulfonema magnum]|uniref:DUF997 family protein n=1 Tax=Desulfonema magnum TaxID=45655 RepID=A0A975GLE8_9BACT|nr:DUF997 domain-containing protein [Desulfonema magnum]QTA84748.1 Uncharacterized protein dnm_007480 [Desulfonema magnum]
MKEQSDKRNGIFIAVFIFLTAMIWCPVIYGRYGDSGRIFSIPGWAFIVIILGIILFIAEWIYLFHTGLSLSDRDLEEIISELDQAKRKEIKS